MPVEPGLTARVSARVTPADTASALGSGDVPVLGTPRLVALCEEAAIAAVAGALPDGMTSVGARIDLEHLAPSPVGATISASAVLTRVEGRSLTFSIEASDDRTVIGRGVVVRVAVDRDRFLGAI